MSLILAIAASCLCARSYWTGDSFAWIWNQEEVATQHVRTLSSGRGGIAFCTCLTTDGTDVPIGVVHYASSDPSYAGIDSDRSAWRHPFIVFHESTDPLDNRWTFAVPIWSILLILLIWPAARARAALRASDRRRAGLCLRCGYDLRATADRCPECGQAIPMRAQPLDERKIT